MCRNINRIGWMFVLMWVMAYACTPIDNGDVVETRRATSLQTTASPELAAIDSLMWQQPDSALARLLPYFDTCCRDAMLASPNTPDDDSMETHTMRLYSRHYAHLLLAELLYKNDCAQTNRKELLQAVAYFDSLVDTRGVSLQPNRRRRDARRASAQNTTATIAFLDARAHYINGVGYYENDSVVDACKEYLKALEIMEAGFKEKELVGHKAQFMALTCTRLTVLFSNLYLQEQAIYFAQLSLSYYDIYNATPWHIAWMLTEIGSNYEIKEQLDSADYYYKNAAIVLNDTSSILYRDISSRQAVLSYKKEGLQKNTFTQLQHILGHANSETEYVARCLSIGGVLFNEKQWDSAWFYLNKVYNNTKSIASKKQAAEWLVEICKMQGRDAEVLEYASFLIPFANQEENQSEIKSQLTELYNAFRQAILSRQHQQEVRKNTRIGLVVVGGLIAGLMAYIFLNHHNRRQKQLLAKQIEEEKLSHDMKQKALSGRLKQSNQKLQETLKRFEEQEEEHKTAENKTSYETFDERYEAFRQSWICLEILDQVKNLHDDIRNTLKTNADVTEYKAFAMTLSQTAQLTKTVGMYFPNLYTALKARYTALDRKEWLHCCLYLLQLDKMSICVLLQEPYYTCRRCVMKLEKVFDCRQGLSSFLVEQSKFR